MRAADYLLRAAVAFSFLYPPVAAVLDPYSWIGYIPTFIAQLPVSDLVLLHSFGALEIVLALWILSGWRIVWPSVAAAFILLTIVTINFNQFSVLFRDVSIALAAVALAVLHWRDHSSQSNRLAVE